MSPVSILCGDDGGVVMMVVVVVLVPSTLVQYHIVEYLKTGDHEQSLC